MLWDISSRQIWWLTWTWRKSTGPVCRGLTEERRLHLLCHNNRGTIQMARIHVSCVHTGSPFPTNLTSICLKAVYTNFNDQLFHNEEGTRLQFSFACMIFHYSCWSILTSTNIVRLNSPGYTICLSKFQKICTLSQIWKMIKTHRNVINK